MKLSFAFITVLAGLAIASPVAEGTAEAEIVDTQAADGHIEERDLIDPNCISCVRKGCGKGAMKCLKGRLPQYVLPCLAFNCADDYIRCCT